MVSQKLKEIRNQRGYSQELLAEKTGLNVRTIQRVENGKTEPRGDTLIRLTETLGVSPDEILEWNKKEDKTYLTVLNLSALLFILFPLLGVIVPFILWITKRDAKKGVNSLGKDLLNFQITWTILFFGSYIGYMLWLSGFFGQGMMVVSFSSFTALYWIIGSLYSFNLLMIVVNAVLLANQKKVWYYPRINFIR